MVLRVPSTASTSRKSISTLRKWQWAPSCAYAGSTLTSGHFKHLLSLFDFFGQFPRLFAKLAPVTSPTRSQKRAQEINFSVKDGSLASIRAIGHAALAADNRLNGDSVDRLAWLLTGDSRIDWPVAKMYTTANDCYTGERLIVGQTVARKNGISLAHATAVSSSLPRRDRSHIAETALLHGRWNLTHLGARGRGRGIEARNRDYTDQWV